MKKEEKKGENVIIARGKEMKKGVYEMVKREQREEKH